MPGPATKWLNAACRMARCIAARPDIKREPSREITLRRRAAKDQLWARRISRCVSPAWPTSYAHPRRVFPSPPAPARANPPPVPLSRRIELHGRRSNLQSYARESASAPHIRYIPSRRHARKFAIADNDTERLMAPRRGAFVFNRLGHVDKSSHEVPD